MPQYHKNFFKTIVAAMEQVPIETFAGDQIDEEEEERDMENASWQNILAPFRDIRNVLVYRQEPPKISLVYLRNCMRLLGILPRIWKGESLYYIAYNKFIIAMMLLFAATITCDLYEASQDIFQLGEDLAILIGIYLVIIKVMVSTYYARDIEHIICEFCKMHKYFRQMNKSRSVRKIRKLQRLFFLIELNLFFFFISVSVALAAAICLCPILTHSGGIPYRAKFPFSLNTYSENPIFFSSVYMYQFIMTLIVLQSVVVIDNLGCHIFNQTTLNLKILCIRIRELGCQLGENRLEELHKAIKFHQYIIGLVTKINHVYYYNSACQMAGSTIIICLTAFEAMLAQDQPIIAIKFQVYMFAAFAQLFFWCGSGNMVYYNSLDVADAAYEIDCWYEESEEFAYCLKFLIRRAQVPLIFRPKPFFGFNFDTFVNIVSTSYSYYALLRTMND